MSRQIVYDILSDAQMNVTINVWQKLNYNITIFMIYLQQNGSIFEFFLKPIHCCWFATYNSAGMASSIWATGESDRSAFGGGLAGGAPGSGASNWMICN